MLRYSRNLPRFLAPRFLRTQIRFNSVNFTPMAGTEAPPSGRKRAPPKDNQGGRGRNMKKQKQEKPVKEGSSEEVILADVRALLVKLNLEDALPKVKEEVDSKLAQDVVAEEKTKLEPADETSAIKVENTEDAEATPGLRPDGLPEQFSEIELEVKEISSTGDGLAVHPPTNRIYVVPFSVPGDVVKAKVITHFSVPTYSLADFVSVVKPSELRDESRVKCQYFGKCGGCQFQMLDYSTQLKHKKTIVEKAYKNFSQLPPELVPAIQDTIGSPIQYGYRTKLTPHFDGPPGCMSRANRKKGIRAKFESVPEIGFMQKGKRQTMDIEDCPIGTDAVRLGMKNERARVARELETYSRGATILLRESTERIYKKDTTDQSDAEGKDPNEITIPPNTLATITPEYTDLKTYVTNNNGEATEYVDNFVFTSIAGSFFQNNNSILPTFTQYIRERALPPASSTSEKDPKIKYLIDAYSGSGLFTITLASLFESSTGIDISPASIESADVNAGLNKLEATRCKFMAADAAELFKKVTYPGDETVVVIDPPRKGCDESFLNQLLKLGPKRVVYVSCNVHTQARDVGYLVRGDGLTTKYEIESLVGFDFFPQTGHVEGVAVLNKAV